MKAENKQKLINKLDKTWQEVRDNIIKHAEENDNIGYTDEEHIYNRITGNVILELYGIEERVKKTLSTPPVNRD